MSRVRDLASILTASSSMATDTEVSVVSAQIPTNVAGKNLLINGGFDIWQRGTSGTFTNGPAWTPDRWWGCVSGGVPTCTISRQTADTIGFNYGARFGRNSGQTGVGTVYFGQTLETSESKLLAGKTITVSFYAKSGTNAPTPLYVGVYTGTGTDQSTNTLFNGGGWTSIGQVNNGITVTSTMTRYNVQMAISSNVTQVMLYFAYTSSGTAGANEWFQIEGVQLEIGSTATSFSRAGGDIQGELAKCQRYYEQSAAAGTVLSEGMSATVNGVASAYSGSDMRSQRFDFKVTKRAVPTMTYYRSNDSATNGRWVYYVNGWTTPNSTSNGLVGYDSFNVYMTSSSAFTTRDCYIVEGGGWSASAEL